MTGAPPLLSLLFSETLLIWQATNYLLSADPIRSGHPGSSRKARTQWVWFVARAAFAAVLIAGLAGWGAGILLAAVMISGCVLLPVARWLWVPSRYTAELEVAGNAAFAAAAQFLIVRFGMRAPWHPVRPSAEIEATAWLVAGALMIFVVRCGTYLVRGVLDRAGTMPPPELPPFKGIQTGGPLAFERALPVDTVELNHGRLIGNVERIILLPTT